MPFLPLQFHPRQNRTPGGACKKNRNDYFCTTWVIQPDLLGRKFRSPKKIALTFVLPMGRAEAWKVATPPTKGCLPKITVGFHAPLPLGDSLNTACQLTP